MHDDLGTSEFFKLGGCFHKDKSNNNVAGHSIPQSLWVLLLVLQPRLSPLLATVSRSNAHCSISSVWLPLSLKSIIENVFTPLGIWWTAKQRICK